MMCYVGNNAEVWINFKLIDPDPYKNILCEENV